MKTEKYPLWNNRRDIPRPGALLCVLLMLATVGLAALTAKGFGGIMSIGVAAVAFAFLLCTVRNILPWLCLPLSFFAAFALSGDVLLSACVLLFALLGLLLAYCVFTEKNLSVTVIILTVAFLISMAAIFTVSVTDVYEGSVRECFASFAADVEKSIREGLEAFRYPSYDGETYSLPSEAVDLLLEVVTMMMPAVLAVTCQVLAYISARLFRAVLILFGYGQYFARKPYRVTVSVPCAVIYLAAMAVNLFSSKASVVAYSALNLAYIIMPAAAVSGFNCLFGKNGILRERTRGSFRSFLTVSVVLMAITAPLSLVQLFSMFSCIYTVIKAAADARKQRKE